MSERGAHVFYCLKCKQMFMNVRKGEIHQSTCKGTSNGFRPGRQPVKTSGTANVEQTADSTTPEATEKNDGGVEVTT